MSYWITVNYNIKKEAFLDLAFSSGLIDPIKFASMESCARKSVHINNKKNVILFRI